MTWFLTYVMAPTTKSKSSLYGRASLASIIRLRFGKIEVRHGVRSEATKRCEYPCEEREAGEEERFDRCYSSPFLHVASLLFILR